MEKRRVPAVDDGRLVVWRVGQFISEQLSETDDPVRMLGNAEIWPGHVVQMPETSRLTSRCPFHSKEVT